MSVKMNPKFYFAPRISVLLTSFALSICAFGLLGPTDTMGHWASGRHRSTTEILQDSRVDQLFRAVLNQTTTSHQTWIRPEDEFIILVEQFLHLYYDWLEIGYLNRDHLLDEICQNPWLVDGDYDGDDEDDDDEEEDDVDILCAVSFLLESLDRLEQMIHDTFMIVQQQHDDDYDDCPDEDCLRKRCCELVRLIIRKRLCPDLAEICEKFILEKFPRRYQNKYSTILRTSGIKRLRIYADSVCHSSIHNPFTSLLWLELINYLDECYRPPWRLHDRTSPSTCPIRSVGVHERNIIETIMLQLFHHIEHILFKH